MAKIDAGQASFTLKLRDQASPRLRRFGDRMAGLGNKMRAFASRVRAVAAPIAMVIGAITAGIASLAKLAADFARVGDEIGKMAVRTGLGVKSLQALRFAAEQSGTSIDALAQALFRARRRIGNVALAGTGPAARAIKTLGIDARRLSQLSPEQQLIELVRALQAVENEAIRNQLAFELFGDNFRQIQPLIAQGADGIAELVNEFDSLGVALSADQVRRAEELTDAWNKLRTSFRLARAQLASTFSPAITARLERFAEQIGELVNGIRLFNQALQRTESFAKRLLNLDLLGREMLLDFALDEVGSGLRDAFGRIADPKSGLSQPMAAFSTQTTSGFEAAVFNALRTDATSPEVTELKEQTSILGDIRGELEDGGVLLP